MGREIKRVPLDFNWPLNETWSGFLMPEALILPTCTDCGGDGYSVEARAIAETFYPHQISGPTAQTLAWHDKIGQAEVDNLLENGRLTTFVNRTPTEDNPRDWEWARMPRTAADVNAEEKRGGLGHDAINHGILVAFRCERLGIEEKCQRCHGYGNVGTDAQREAYDNWRGEEPPTGDGWQVWETVSEGSPVSPVYPTRDAMVAALVKEGHSPRAAQNFVDAGSAPSIIIRGGILKQDIDSCEDL